MTQHALILFNGTCQHSRSNVYDNHNWIFSTISKSILKTTPYASNTIHNTKLADNTAILFGEFDGVATQGPWLTRLWNLVFADDLGDKTQAIYQSLCNNPEFNKLHTITLIGNSRGGYSALLIAYMLKQSQQHRKLNIHLILNDPVDGPGGTYCAELPDLANTKNIRISIDTLLPTANPKLYFYQLNYRLMRATNNIRTFVMNCSHSAACFHPHHPLQLQAQRNLNHTTQIHNRTLTNPSHSNTTTLLYNLIKHSTHNPSLAKHLDQHQPNIVPRLTINELASFFNLHKEHILATHKKLPNPATTYLHEHFIPQEKIIAHINTSIEKLAHLSYPEKRVKTTDLDDFNQTKALYSFVQEQQLKQPHQHSLNFFTQPFVLIYYYLQQLINHLCAYLHPKVTINTTQLLPTKSPASMTSTNKRRPRRPRSETNYTASENRLEPH